MRVLAVAVLLLASIVATPAAAKTIHQIELKGNVRILSADTPVRKGRVYVFHRYPDGVYLSVPSQDVLGIAATSTPAAAGAIALGPTGEGQSSPDEAGSADRAVAGEAVFDDGAGYDLGYGYGYGYGNGGPVRPPRPRPVHIGSNGFPLLPGSPQPLPIGQNGYPILLTPVWPR